MRYIYKHDNGFNIGHYIFAWLGTFVKLFAVILKFLTLNLVWFDFELNWIVYSLENQDKLNNYLKKFFKKVKT